MRFPPWRALCNGRSSMTRLVLPVSERDHVSGATSPLVTLVEYGDYECPHCGIAWPIMKALELRFGRWVRFCFRNFPLSNQHPHAQTAAEAAEAAAAQGQFWPMHDLLFQHQNALGYAQVLKYAATLPLDRLRFAEELATHVHAEQVRRDFRSGVRSGVNGTPTFFIDDVRHDAGYDYQSLANALQAALVRANADGIPA